MNKLVIIGNGFDLAHGMKTRYEDFILWYLNKQLNNVNRTTENDLISITSPYSNVLQYKTISDFFVGASDNRFTIKYNSDFFKKIVRHSDYKWVDIENEYFKELLSGLLYFLKNNNDYLNDSDIKDIIELNIAKTM